MKEHISRSSTLTTHSPQKLSVPASTTRPPSELTKEIEALLPRIYPDSSTALFHNTSHALETRDIVLMLAQRAQESGAKVDAVALEHAALLHDAQYDQSPAALGMSSREHMHAAAAVSILRSLGSPEDHAQKVHTIIIATNARVEPQTIEEKLMRAADLFNLQNDYQQFRDNAYKLYQEAFSLHGQSEPLTFSQFCRNQLRYLAIYALPLLHVTDMATQSAKGASSWHEGFLRNAFRLFREEVNPKGVIVADLSPLEQASDMNHLNADALIVRAHPVRETRERMLAAAQNSKDQSPAQIVFVVPGTISSTPIPSKSCDIVCSGPIAPSDEANRLLRPGGKLLAG